MKLKLPKALREQVWLVHIGKHFEHKCLVGWCENLITPFNFECGHNIPESKGGSSDIDNLRPICGNCNRSMGSSYTIDEFSNMSKRTSHLFECFRFKKNAVN
jgi:5-methylcytosine-specific restriction endonuclease McrA